MSPSPVFHVTGMHCPACESLIAEEVGLDPAVASVRVSRPENRLWVELAVAEDLEVLKQRLNRRLESFGYRVWLEGEDPARLRRRETWLGLLLGGVVLALFLALQAAGVLDLFAPESLDWKGAFVLGLLASVSSCFALVGGLLVTFSTAVGRRNPRALVPGLAALHGSRLAVFAVGGALLGALGAALGPSFDGQRVLLTLAALIMAGLGLNLLGVPVPILGSGKRTLHRAQRAAAQGQGGSGAAVWGGATLGALTFFLPCGFTQSVQFQALAAGGPSEGALLTLAFALGTAPVLLSVSWLLGRGLSGQRRALVLKAGGALVLGLGVFQLWGALRLWGLHV